MDFVCVAHPFPLDMDLYSFKAYIGIAHNFSTMGEKR